MKPYTPEQLKHIELVKKHVKVGDILTHTMCMGIISEHYFTRYDGNWLCGNPTSDTAKLAGPKFEEYEVNDIAPINVTHINRVPVAAVEFLVKDEDMRKIG
jgi:hypothetical protein